MAGAGKIFQQKGYERASMAEIAKEASVSKGTLYNHFNNKADLFTAFFEEMSHTKLKIFETLLRSEESDIEKTLINYARAVIELLLSSVSLNLYRIIVAEAERFPNLADTFWQYGSARTIGYLAQFFERKTTEKMLKVEDPVLAAELFLMMCQTRLVQKKRLQLPVKTNPEHIEEIVQLVTRSFLSIYAPQK
ncbi:hypothetical protein DM15PD_06750 [Aristophania vespae]|nr:hypothetical protein DM15PD_06750 [Aristophania vespae]